MCCINHSGPLFYRVLNHLGPKSFSLFRSTLKIRDHRIFEVINQSQPIVRRDIFQFYCIRGLRGRRLLILPVFCSLNPLILILRLVGYVKTVVNAVLLVRWAPIPLFAIDHLSTTVLLYTPIVQSKIGTTSRLTRGGG